MAPRSTPYLTLSAALLALGCDPQQINPRYQALPRPPVADPVSDDLVVIADTHLHNVLSEPFALDSDLVKHVVRVAIRPPQLDLFAPDLLRFARQLARGAPLVLLGDSIDLGCAGEWSRFVQTMESVPNAGEWIFVPGNHDSYFFGNAEAIGNEWERACANADGPMHKDKLVESYLGVLRQRKDAVGRQLDDWAKAKPTPLFDNVYQWSFKPEASQRPTLVGVAYSIDPIEKWKSFIVQKLDIDYRGSAPHDCRQRHDCGAGYDCRAGACVAVAPPTRIGAILIDSANYTRSPELVPGLIHKNAGISGEVTDAQRKVIERWLDEADKSGELIIAMSHHPFNSLDCKTRQLIERHLKSGRIILYVSAHTHVGQWITHGDGWPELNIGSLLDGPSEFRHLQVQKDESGKLVVQSRLERLEEKLWHRVQGTPSCRSEWIPQPGDDDAFLPYWNDYSPVADHARNQMLDTLLRSYRKLFERMPALPPSIPQTVCGKSSTEIAQCIDGALTDEKKRIPALKALREIDEARGPILCADKVQCEWRDYRLCQALEASKYFSIGAQTLTVRDELLQLP